MLLKWENTHCFVLFIVIIISDIITIEHSSTVAKNIFSELNKQFEKLTHCRKSNFLKNTTTKTLRDVSSKTFTMTLTLLPHQILMLPESYKSALSKSVLYHEKLTMYTDKDLR